MSNLFGGNKMQPQPVVRMPDSKSPDVLEAMRRERDAITKGRGGRASTILTGSPNGATAPVYQNNQMGGAQ